ncbi:MAG: U32 family peptidase [Planctomycetota bacterium]|nr:MAG: U32 family peptidase [Planctomycetota bacterium]
MTAGRERIELLAPAGNWQCARAAIESGADAIYFGLDTGFNARARAANFHLDELPELMVQLRRQKVRGYVTLNTLVFSDELPSLEDHVRAIADAGADAVIVQDLGVARLVRRLCPELPIHASTQMTLTHPAAIDMVRELGIDRVVLARELSLAEIRKITEATNVPVEAFVHGALCVAYSGQCLTSESFGGRSANRGQCAQACRLPYDLICDGTEQDLGPVRYLLSPQDLAAHDLVPQLIDAGVSSLKIEGRLKSPEYVANVCHHYRSAIDRTLQGQFAPLTPEQKYELELSFSRGFSPGWLEGCDHKRLTPGLSSAKRGALLGELLNWRRDAIEVRVVAPVALGDGIVIEGDRFENAEIGSRVFSLRRGKRSVESAESGRVWIGLRRGTLPTEADNRLRRGMQVFKTDDPRLSKRLQTRYQTVGGQKKIPVAVRVRVAVAEPVEMVVATPDLEPLTIGLEFCPAEARQHAVTDSQLREQLGRLGNTVYTLSEFQLDTVGRPMLPLSVMGQMRRRMLQELDRRRRPSPLTCQAQPVVPQMLSSVRPQDDDSKSSNPQTVGPTLRVLCRSLRQVELALDHGARDLIADFHDIRRYADAVRIVHDAGGRIELATLRIIKPGENGLLRALARHPADGWLARNLVAIEYCRRHAIPFVSDFSLNATNPLTAQQLRAWGAQRITASYDLNRDQLLELVGQAPAKWFEVVIHQHMPMFHMEHCVFCSVLSPGRNKSDCGRPCDRHQVELRDRVGASHPLHADIGCRNTLYNGTAQSGAEAVAPLLKLGVRHFRIELLSEADRTVVATLIDLYRHLLDGRLSGREVWQQLRADNRIGVTRGTMEQPRNPLAIL